MVKQKKKSLYASLTRIQKSKHKENPVYQMSIGIEAKIESHPFLEDWGFWYQSMLRSGLNDMQHGKTSDQIEKEYQSKFNINWAWADSLATQVKQLFDQLTTAKSNQIESLDQDIKSGKEQVTESIQKLSDALLNPTKRNTRGFDQKLLGLKSKLKRLEKKKKQLIKLQKATRLHICFGSAKLFNAQHHLEANGYKDRSEWKSDWDKARSGNFYAVGKGSVNGNNPVAKIHHKQDDIFTVTFTVPKFLSSDYGHSVQLEFVVTGQRKHDLLYAISAQKPITVQCFIREHKSDQWYIHLTTYVQCVPRTTSKNNGCIGIDLNAETIDIIYIKRDGNIKVDNGKRVIFTFAIPTGSTGQVNALLRDIVVQIVALAELYQCPIACENLDFSVKKASMRHDGSSNYNRMLSGFIYDKFRSFLVARAEKRGVEVIFVNPAFTSIIGLFKFMPKYGLNSATAAAMAIARRGLGIRDKVTRQMLNALFLPEDGDKASWKTWAKFSSMTRKHSIKRHQLFQLAKVLEVFISSARPTRRRRKVKTTSS